ncbi:serine hydrolase domain-containing protein [Chitinophaga flava]|uniref:Beta-lactamase-related domain-containing protein n=1 Tax=Chitinophaga flava TaxID=2259036 RepID=A0A365Y414_9BACT|nr:serine hydrolase domain-containing protein [Chitinophaga flava]RBL93326.1 hypothetical protein DF182_12430 [Chitinophaga flava]
MKKVFIVLACFLFISETYAQEASQQQYDTLKDSIVAQFSRSDYHAIYSLMDPSYFKIEEPAFVSFLKNIKSNSGEIVQTKFLADSVFEGSNSGRARYYLAEFQLRSLLMVLEATPHGKISLFALIHYEYPPITATADIPSSNPLSSPLDRMVDSAAREYFQHQYATGLSIGIIKNGQRYVYHYGTTSKAKPQLPANKTLYEIGSITKTFTGTILAHAVLENKVRLSDDIRKYLDGSFPNLEYNGHPITLKDLANHTSRIPTVPDDLFSQRGVNLLAPWNDYNEKMFWEALHRVKPDTISGYKFQYSNLGMSLLGHILARVYKQPYEKLVEKYITQPMKMGGTTVLPLKDKNELLALKYSSNGYLLPYWHQQAFLPAGIGMVSNIDDMLNYLSYQIADSDPTIQLTHQPTSENVGLSWGIGNPGTPYKLYEHSGGTYGFTTIIRAFPEAKAGIVILTNTDVDIMQLTRRISRYIIN